MVFHDLIKLVLSRSTSLTIEFPHLWIVVHGVQALHYAPFEGTKGTFDLGSLLLSKHVAKRAHPVFLRHTRDVIAVLMNPFTTLAAIDNPVIFLVIP